MLTRHSGSLDQLQLSGTVQLPLVCEGALGCVTSAVSLEVGNRRLSLLASAPEEDSPGVKDLREGGGFCVPRGPGCAFVSVLQNE